MTRARARLAVVDTERSKKNQNMLWRLTGMGCMWGKGGIKYGRWHHDSSMNNCLGGISLSSTFLYLQLPISVSTYLSPIYDLSISICAIYVFGKRYCLESHIWLWKIITPSFWRSLCWEFCETFKRKCHRISWVCMSGTQKEDPS